jgi:WD40 repeat protein
MTNERFSYDLFLSHSLADKAIVRPLAERLRGDGLKVWFDEWEIKPDDNRQDKIEDGLERSRVLVLCMSTNAFGSDWAQLESGTFRFRDPLNKERRFIPLRLDDVEIKGSLAQFLFIDWRPAGREQEYEKLVEACRPTVEVTTTEAEKAKKLVSERTIQLDYKYVAIYAYAFSSDGKRILTGSADSKVRLWNNKTGYCQVVFEDHTDVVLTVALSPDGKLALSGGSNRDNMRLWDVESGRCLRVFDTTQTVWQVKWSPNGRFALSGALDKTVQLWDIESGRCIRVLEGHKSWICSVAWSSDGKLVLSGADDKTIRLWNIESGQCLRVLKGHTRKVWSVTWSPDGKLALSGAADNTVRLWEIDSGRCLLVFEGHTNVVWSVAWNPDGNLALSGSADNNVRLWSIELSRCLSVFEGHKSPIKAVAWSADALHAFTGDEYCGINVWDLSEFVTKAKAAKVTVPNALLKWYSGPRFSDSGLRW